ncbi:MAG: Uncharacterised protein [uncultured Bacteroidota bacterium]|nr:MAG: Uncharacterised protein [uncultured Bacteroidetes bacterium]
MKAFKRPLIALVLSLILMQVSEQFSLRFDLTVDKRYSLSEATLTQLNSLDKPLRIDVFLTGDLPGLYRDFRGELDVFLSQLEYATDKLIIQYNDPFDIGSNEAVVREMQQYGMNPEIVIENKDGQRNENLVFPWMIVNYGEVSERVSLLSKQLGDTDRDKISRSVQQMEYLIMDGIGKVTRETKSTIAVLTSHQTSENRKLADFLQSLRPYYNLASFDLKNPEISPEQSLTNLNRFKTLIISNPIEAFTQSEKYILDQYSLQGGGLLWLVNGVGIDRDSLFNSAGKAYGFPLELNLDDYFFNQGIRINKALVQDLYCAPIVLANGSENNTQFIPYPWPYYPLPKPESNLIGERIGPVLTQFASSIDALENSMNQSVLLQTSGFTKTAAVPVVISLDQATEKIQPSIYDEPSKILGLLSEGKQKSLFANRILPFENTEHLNEGQTKSIVFGDGNLAENQLDKGAPLQLGYDKWTSNFYANKELLMHAVHYLSGNLDGLLIRQKEWNLAYLDAQKIKAKGVLWKVMMLLTPLVVALGFGWLNQRGRSKHLGA